MSGHYKWPAAWGVAGEDSGALWDVSWLSAEEFWARTVQRQASDGNKLADSGPHVLNGACHVPKAGGSWDSPYLYIYSLPTAAVWDISSQGGCEEVGGW